MNRSIRAGLVYFAIVFAAGFALGTLRVFVVAPAFGELAAVLVELPIILAASWFACEFVLHRCAIGPDFEERAMMGLVAFGVLMAAEFVMANVGFDRSLGEHFARYAEPAAAIGLAGQMAFGAMPLFRL